MSDSYIGFRIEIASRIITADISKLIDQYNTDNQKIFDLHTNGRISIEHKDSMLIARGENDQGKNNNIRNINFSVMIPIETKEIDRIVQIVNVLGNGRLIRERVKTFVDGQSMLNKLPELTGLVIALSNIDLYIPGFISGSWYYAPEAKF